MRFAILVKATEASEAGVLPGEETLREVVEYHEELQRAGVLYDAMGLRPTREGWRIKYSGPTRSVVEGPFVEAKDQIAGYTIIQVRSREEAMGWAMRFPWPTHDMNVDGEIEVRQVLDLEDFVQGPAIARFRQLGPLDRIATDGARAPPSRPQQPQTAPRRSCSRTSRGRHSSQSGSATASGCPCCASTTRSCEP